MLPSPAPAGRAGVRCRLSKEEGADAGTAMRDAGTRRAANERGPEPTALPL